MANSREVASSAACSGLVRGTGLPTPQPPRKLLTFTEWQNVNVGAGCERGQRDGAGPRRPGPSALTSEEPPMQTMAITVRYARFLHRRLATITFGVTSYHRQPRRCGWRRVDPAGN